jgi:ATPase family AAA domain-containing protein 1
LKFVRAIFTLAKKLAPTIIFIDEIDGFLRQRGLVVESETSVAIKAEFMALWDGVLSDEGIACGSNINAQILVIGATNRPQDIDEAILRRLPRKFSFDLPDSASRMSILKALLKNSQTDNIDLVYLGSMLEGYSGSDIKEICRYALTSSLDHGEGLSICHFLNAKSNILPSVKRLQHHELQHN